MAPIKAVNCTIEFDDRARRELRKLDPQVQSVILRYFRTRIYSTKDPRQSGKALTGELAGLWRYRIGDYRAVCEVQERKLIVLVLRIGHRREIYR